MPAYVHSYLEVVSSGPDGIVLRRNPIPGLLIVGGLGLVGIAFCVAIAMVERGDYRFALGVGAVILLIAAVACLPLAKRERISFERASRSVVLPSGQRVPFSDVTGLIVLETRDSDSDEAYGLALLTATGHHAFSELWCWNEARVRATAAAIMAVFPELVLTESRRLVD